MLIGNFILQRNGINGKLLVVIVVKEEGGKRWKK